MSWKAAGSLMAAYLVKAAALYQSGDHCRRPVPLSVGCLLRCAHRDAWQAAAVWPHAARPRPLHLLLARQREGGTLVQSEDVLAGKAQLADLEQRTAQAHRGGFLDGET